MYVYAYFGRIFLMSKPFDESTLPEPDWSKKPIVVLVGVAPDNAKYRALYNFLEDQLIAGAIEVVHLKPKDIAPNALIFDDTYEFDDGISAEGKAFVPQLNFTFSDLDNPGISRLESDPGLKRLSSTTRLGNPPTIVIGLQKEDPLEFVKIHLASRVSGVGPDYKADKVLTVQLKKNPSSTDGLFIGSSDDTFLANYDYFASAHGLIAYTAASRNHNNKNIIQLLIAKKALELAMVSSLNETGSSTTVKVEGSLLDLATKFSKGKLSDSEVARLKTLLFEEISSGNIHPHTFVRGGRSWRNDEEPRFPLGFKEQDDLLNYLETYLSNAREKRLEEVRGVDPELLPAALRDEIETLTAEEELLRKKAAGVRADIANGRRELAQVTAEVDTQRAVVQAELEVLDTRAQELANESNRLELVVSEEITRANSLALSMSKLLHQIDLHSDAVNLSGRQGRKERRAQASRKTTARDHFSHQTIFHNIAAKIRTEPNNPISLFDATTFYIAQKLFAVSRVDDTSVVVDPRRSAGALILAYGHATEIEREWFDSLDELIPDDIANMLVAQLAEAAITRDHTDHRFTMKDLGAMLGRASSAIEADTKGIPAIPTITTSTRPANGQPELAIEATVIDVAPTATPQPATEPPGR